MRAGPTTRRRRRACLGASLLGCGLATGACSLTSLDGLSGGEAPPAITDSDAGNDAPTVPRVEAGPVEAAVEASTTTFCGAHPDAQFCDDFDEAPFGAKWTDQLNVMAQGSLTANDAGFVSAPSSLVMQVAGNNATGGYEQLELYRDFALPANAEAHFSCDFRMDAIDPVAALNTFVLEIGQQPDQVYAIGLIVKSDGAVIEEATPKNDAGARSFIDTPLGVYPVVQKWVHIALDVVLSKVQPRFSISLDGVPVIVDHALDPRYRSGKVRLLLGLPFAAFPVTGLRLRYDNVLLDFK